jgi:DNA-binding CsgD family transcriptional regulator
MVKVGAGSRPSPGRPPLTPRERIVMAHIVGGASNKEVARALNISPRTVEFHRANILHKLGARNTVELVRRLIDEARHVAPHIGVYTRLQPSQIHGVGVFAIMPIRKGSQLFQNDEEIVWVDEEDVAKLPRDLKKLYDDFAIIKDGWYGCPSNFNQLTTRWYLNNLDSPNVAVDDKYKMTALRDIEVGEELTIDSSKFRQQPYENSD